MFLITYIAKKGETFDGYIDKNQQDAEKKTDFRNNELVFKKLLNN
jgi:hypothetical protein